MTREALEFDVLVIGGGVVGLTVAAHLADEKRVAVLEREPVLCFHATGRSSAMFAPNYGGPAVRPLTAASASFFSDPAAPFANRLITARPILHVARRTQRARLSRLVASAAKGAVFEHLGPSGIRRYWPELRGEFVEGMLEHRAGDIDIDALVLGFRAKLRAAGAVIATNVGEAPIERAGGFWRVAARDTDYRAPLLVNAAGAWADDVARRAGVMRRGLTPLRRTVVLMAAPSDHSFRTRPTVFDIDERFYFRPFAGAMLVTPCDETPCCPCDATPSIEDVARAAAVHERALDQPVRRILARWAGLRTFAADRAPILGAAPDAPGFFWAAGLGGFGVQTAPAVGELIAGLILGGRLRPRLARYGVDLGLYDPARTSLTSERELL